MIYRFAAFELDDARYELRCNGEIVGLPPKCFDVLCHLVRNSGRVVSKKELFATLWPGEHLGGSTLPVTIRKIRKALGETQCGEIIRTMHGRGYSVACPVEQGKAQFSATSEQRRPFVGRGPLLQQLQSVFRAAAAGESRVVLLYGEAGIGKTSVLEEFMRWCRALPAPALIADVRCKEASGAPPFWALHQLLRAGRAALHAGALRALAQQQNYDPEPVAARLHALLRPDPKSGLGADAIRFQLIRATLQVVEEVTRIAPTVLVVDDLHCMDDGSLRVWEALVRGGRSNRLLLLGAYRDTELSAEHSLSRVLGSIATEPRLREIALGPLDAGAVNEFVREVLDVQPEPQLVRSLLERTEGNPFFLREFLRLLAAESTAGAQATVDFAQLDLTPAGREVINRRLRGVSFQCNEILAWASVIGRQFSLPLLEQLCAVSSQKLLELLCEGVDAGIIASDAAPNSQGRFPLGHYGFAHALIRDAIYMRFSRPERALRHRAVGEAIERMRGPGSSARLHDLAHHFVEAAPAGAVDRAAGYCAEAARHALSVCAYEDAVRHIENALRVEELRRPADVERICTMTLAFADGLRWAGRYPEARMPYMRAAEAARALSRPDLLARCAIGLLRRLPLIRQDFVCAAAAQPGEEPPREVLSLADEALQALGDSHEALQARLLAVRSCVEAAERRWSSASTLSKQALQLARRSQDPRAQFDALIAKRASAHLPHEAPLALRISGELFELLGHCEAKPEAKPLLFTAYEMQIPALIALGKMAEADRDLAAAAQIAAELRVPTYNYAVVRFQLARAIGDGRLQDAHELIARVLELGNEIGDPNTPRYQIVKNWIACAEGRAGRVQTALESVSNSGQIASTPAHILFAHFFADVGQRQRCVQHFELSARADFADLAMDDDWLWLLCTAADVCARLRDEQRAEVLYERISPHAHLNVTSSLFIYMGSASLSLGRLAFVLQDLESAHRHYEAALEFNRKIGAFSALLFTQYEYGLALQRGNTKQRDQGRALLSTAAQLASAGGVIRLHGRPLAASARP